MDEASTHRPSERMLRTERLLLRRRRPEEAGVYRRLWEERDPRVPDHRRIGIDGRPTAADIAAAIRAEDDDERWGLLAVERIEQADVIGYCGLVAPDRPGGDPELAFELLQAVHGRGYATEAGAAIVGWAESTGIPRLRASVWEWNIASRRVLEKLGFRDTGIPGPVGAHGRTLILERRL